MCWQLVGQSRSNSVEVLFILNPTEEVIGYDLVRRINSGFRYHVWLAFSQPGDMNTLRALVLALLAVMFFNSVSPHKRRDKKMHRNRGLGFKPGND